MSTAQSPDSANKPEHFQSGRFVFVFMRKGHIKVQFNGSSLNGKNQASIPVPRLVFETSINRVGLVFETSINSKNIYKLLNCPYW